LTLTDAEFRALWWPRLPASDTKPQSVQDRVYPRYVAACHAHDGLQQQVRAEAEAAQRRASEAG
jgi:hypothetical protein